MKHNCKKVHYLILNQYEKCKTYKIILDNRTNTYNNIIIGIIDEVVSLS